MRIWTNNVINEYLEEKFGANDKTMPNIKGMPTTSFHIGWEHLPENTISLAVILEDHDAIEVCGFTWIHWIACNINPKIKELPVNASVELKDQMVQGKNSWASPLLGEGQVVESLFGGCAPPNKDHTYVLKVYALNTKLDLENGFSKNQLLHAMKGCIIDKAHLLFKYKKLH